MLHESGHVVDIQPLRKVRALLDYRMVVMGAPIYIGSLHKDAQSKPETCLRWFWNLHSSPDSDPEKLDPTMAIFLPNDPLGQVDIQQIPPTCLGYPGRHHTVA